MNKELEKDIKLAIAEARDDYHDGNIECGEVPDRAAELLSHRLDCSGQRIHCFAYWDEDDDPISSIIEDTVSFCREHTVEQYNIVYDDIAGFTFVLYITKEA